MDHSSLILKIEHRSVIFLKEMLEEIMPEFLELTVLSLTDNNKIFITLHTGQALNLYLNLILVLLSPSISPSSICFCLALNALIALASILFMRKNAYKLAQ